MSTIIDQDATYVAAIKNSIGSKQFRNLFADVDGKRMDLTENGRLACAFYVSWILFHFGYLKDPHVTVDGTVKDLRANGWVDTEDPKEGDVLVWEPTMDHDPEQPHQHIGFYLGNGRAASNSSKLGEIFEHDSTFEGKRRLISILSRPAQTQSR
ncbi:CHAP domain-containing protein [Candidatus Uhrbacteria bacterium]|nr:CHAP domain-containing protein [Candidatus Uhrbacteria bacterium]